mmetsp:Transcript_11432/g.27424  ORF Transcript_11432/g.27424 Transcript_11432/m.27424 type:complete len:210 (-) Transcript_11432:271-900(-)
MSVQEKLPRAEFHCTWLRNLALLFEGLLLQSFDNSVQGRAFLLSPEEGRDAPKAGTKPPFSDSLLQLPVECLSLGSQKLPLLHEVLNQLLLGFEVDFHGPLSCLRFTQLVLLVPERSLQLILSAELRFVKTAAPRTHSLQCLLQHPAGSQGLQDLLDHLTGLLLGLDAIDVEKCPQVCPQVHLWARRGGVRFRHWFFLLLLLKAGLEAG